MSALTRHKVVLYNPKAVFWTMPLALLAVGSALDPTRYEVKIIDGRLEADPLGAVLRETKDALCLGISVLTGEPLRDALEVSRAAKREFPNLPVVWGGWHPSLFPAECLAEPSVDIAVSGQGEATFAEVVARLDGGANLSGVQGVTWRDSEGNVLTNPARPTADVNLFPRHNYDLIDVEAYYRHKGKRQLDYISSVGCRFRCAFCADPFVYNRSWYGLTATRIAQELGELSRKYPFEEVAFQDETYFTRRERVEEICRAFLDAGLRFTWTGTMRADQGHRLPDETLTLCRQAGLRRVMIGVEAGTDEMLKRIKKDITVAQVFTTAEKLVRHRIGAIWNFIVGFPDEPEESFEATMEIAKRLRAMSHDFEAAVFFYKPYPGNELAEQVRAANYAFPCSLEEWADFDYVGSAGPWVSREKFQRVERFKFYQKYAFGRHEHPLALPLQALARWRVDRDFYSFPIEQKVVEALHPAPKLS
ncbi:MAG: B12-binding domain-containing radical SAM protein [Chloroflexota bacterium]|nr:B12-binding domain-containing radical SAM protein [Chloroflexota bacterium]